MKREQVMNSIALKKRFCKNNNLPIVVYDNPYFYERLCTLDVLFNCVDKFEDFCEELSMYLSEQEYMEYYNSVKENVIKHIKSKEEYSKFNEEFIYVDTTAFVNRNLYVESNNNKTFISIDMKKANFSAMSHYSSKIFDDARTWEDFLLHFTKSRHIIASKYIRQVIFGACNPKQQIRYERFLMLSLLQYIENNIDGVNVFSFGSDEIILHIENSKYSLQKLKDVVSNSPIGSIVRITMFDAEAIKGTKGWLKRIYNFKNSDEIIEFKCLDAEIFHQIVKHYYNEPITDNDLVFRHNGHLARFLTEVDNPWE